MNVQSLGVTPEAALVALREYKTHRDTYDRRDWEIERIYRAISKGKTVISVNDAIVRAGLDANKRPNLAICEAHAAFCVCNAHGDKLTFGVADTTRRWFDGGGKITVPWPDVGYGRPGLAAVPRIPPQHRPHTSNLANYHILWEAEWGDLPRDPYLLKRIGRDAWVVLAAWDLTDVEISVLRAHGDSRLPQ